MLVTDYLEEFQCIGSDCEDTCCAGWQVHIDRTTFKRYQKVNNPQLKSLFNTSLKKTRGQKRSDAAFASVKLDSKGACPMLDKKGLCQIHGAMGEKALSKTCRSYPRILNMVDGMVEASAKLSCPQAARLALLRPNGIEFNESELDLDGLSLLNNISTQSQAPNQTNRYLWQLQLHAIETLKNRQLPLWKRMMLLGLVYRKLDEAGESLNEELVNSTIQSYQQLIQQQEYNEALDKLQFSSEVMLTLVSEFVDLRKTAGFGSQRFLECHDLAIDYLTDGQSQDANISDRYESAYREHYSPFMQKHDYILENYLVNFAYQNLVPTNSAKKLSDNFMTMVMNYAVIRLYLVAVAGKKQSEFGSDDVIKIIQSFTKVVEHSSSFMEKVQQHFSSKGQNGMAYMSLLLKDPELPAAPVKRPKNVLELDFA